MATCLKSVIYENRDLICIIYYIQKESSKAACKRKFSMQISMSVVDGTRKNKPNFSGKEHADWTLTKNISNSVWSRLPKSVFYIQ